jgi:hypothetical protein
LALGKRMGSAAKLRSSAHFNVNWRLGLSCPPGSRQ